MTGEGPNHVMLSEIDGDRTFHVYRSQIGEVYQGHCNPRFVTEEARQRFVRERLPPIELLTSPTTAR